MRIKSKIIKKFVLELGGRTIELSPEEARELFDSLEELFGQKIVREYRDYYKWYPSYPGGLIYLNSNTHNGTTTVVSPKLGQLTTHAGSQISEQNGTVTCRLAANNEIT